MNFLDLWDFLLIEMEKTHPNMKYVKEVVGKMNKELN